MVFQELKSNSKSQNEAEAHVLALEKVYGDFKRLHAYIEETFKNEIVEYERFEAM